MEASSLYNSIFCFCAVAAAAYCTFLAFHGSIVRGFVARRHSDRAISLLCSLGSLRAEWVVGYTGGLPEATDRQPALTRKIVCFVFVSDSVCRHLSVVVFTFRILSHLPVRLAHLT